jgi:hypothetical protein
MRLAVASVGDCGGLDGGARDARWSPNAVVSPVALRRAAGFEASGRMDWFRGFAVRSETSELDPGWRLGPMGASAPRPANG